MFATLLRVPMLSPWLPRILSLLAATGLAASTALPQEVPLAMQGTTQPVVFLIRDCAGNPMRGVAMKILIDSPPDLEEHDQCLTAEDGTCTVHLLPRTYRVRFVKGWHGRMFIPVEEQEVFRFSFEQSNEIAFFTLAVAERDGELVPVWDMSRDAGQPPEPFLPDFGAGDPLADLYLGPLSTIEGGAGEPAEQPAAPDAAPTAQVVVDELVPGGVPEPATEAPAATAAAETQAGDDGLTLRMLIGLLFAMAVVVMLILLVVVIANRPKKKEG